MKKYIIPFISIIYLCLLLILGIAAFSSLKILSLENKMESINGKFIESIRKEFDQQIPIEDFAISFWSGLKFSLFKEGSKGELTGRENWLFTTEEFEENLEGEFSRADYFKRISHVQNYFQQRDISLVLVLIPSKSRIYSDQLPGYPPSERQQSRYSDAVETLRSSSINVVNLKQPFLNRKGEEQLFYKYDTHWTFEGALLSAEEIKKQINPILLKQKRNERSFSLTITNELPFKGDLLDYVPALNEEWESYKETEIIDSAPPVLGLFDSLEIPLILVGTSYSADHRWNFENILKNSLKLDVLNLAEEGKGPFPPMEALMESEYYKEINSKIIIWEIPERYIPLR